MECLLDQSTQPMLLKDVDYYVYEIAYSLSEYFTQFNASCSSSPVIPFGPRGIVMVDCACVIGNFQQMCIYIFRREILFRINPYSCTELDVIGSL